LTSILSGLILTPPSMQVVVEPGYRIDVSTDVSTNANEPTIPRERLGTVFLERLTLMKNDRTFAMRTSTQGHSRIPERNAMGNIRNPTRPLNWE
ncbi:MAG: hypothetical protein AAFX51_05915, partial [Cyanobacteria bacterium J06636_28]